MAAVENGLPGYSVSLAWQVQVGRVKLYLLDSNDAANFPRIEGVADQLTLLAAGPNCASTSCSASAARLLDAGIEPKFVT